MVASRVIGMGTRCTIAMVSSNADCMARTITWCAFATRDRYGRALLRVGPDDSGHVPTTHDL